MLRSCIMHSMCVSEFSEVHTWNALKETHSKPLKILLKWNSFYLLIVCSPIKTGITLVNASHLNTYVSTLFLYFALFVHSQAEKRKQKHEIDPNSCWKQADVWMRFVFVCALKLVREQAAPTSLQFNQTERKHYFIPNKSIMKFEYFVKKNRNFVFAHALSYGRDAQLLFDCYTIAVCAIRWQYFLAENIIQ